MRLFKDRYRIESARLKGWDYSSAGQYFITLCTKNRDCIFGEIINGEMILNDIGFIVDLEWKKSFEIRQELKCDCFMIMPNHLHAIVEIQKTVPTGGRIHSDTSTGGCRDARPCVSTATTGTVGTVRSPKSISSFVAGFKSSATKLINENRNLPGVPVWQPRFHDHIIRDEMELIRIRNYIRSNPAKWINDDFHVYKTDHRKVIL